MTTNETKPPRLTAYQSYRSMKWTSDEDTCEHCSTVVLAEGSYIEGRFGNYCSDACLGDAEGDEDVVAIERRAERQQMGLSDL